MNVHVTPPMSEKQIRLLAAADMIEHLRPSQFDMAQWPCCLAGHIAKHRNPHLQMHAEVISNVAATWLLLTTDEEAKLFMPTLHDVFPETLRAASPDYRKMSVAMISPQWTARVLRHLAYTGRVDWQATRTVPKSINSKIAA